MIREILNQAISSHCAPCFPFVWDRNTVDDLPFFYICLIHLPEIKAICFCSCLFP